ncbi:MAG: UPF0280 family protein [Candidatus Omnitrophota bacterium]|nr:UPF0280 family protein [Candidatus Omnitrophota bacterium]
MSQVQKEYRNWIKSKDLVSFEVLKGETNLLISAERNLTIQAETLTQECRRMIEDYIKIYPQFKDSLRPMETSGVAAQAVEKMLAASRLANVGPMAAVAGSVAEYVGKGLLNFSSEIIVENGGDIFIKSSQDRIVGIYAGRSLLSGKVNLKISKAQFPLGICTSSGKIGHSLSFGKADSVTVISDSAALADAAATAIGNIIKTPADISRAIDRAKAIKGVKGIVIIVGEKLAAWGEIEIA